MEYKKDLLRKSDKSIFRLILGISMCVISLFWIIARLEENEGIRPFDWVYSGFFTLSGVTHILTGLGISIESFFGKAFVHIDNETIDIKLGVFEKEFKIDWQDIKSIDYKSGDYTFQKLDNSSIFFPISKLDYSSILDIRNTLLKFAESKNIRYNIQ